MMENELPEGWIVRRLGEIATKITDGSHNPPKAQEEGFPMLSAKNIQNGLIDFNGYRLISKESFNQEYKRANVEPGDILLTIVGTIGRCAVVSANHGLFTLQRSVALIKPQINSYYLYYYFLSPAFQNELEINTRGTAQKGVYLNALNQIPIIFPPLAEQKRIVAKLDAAFGHLETLKTSLNRIPELLKKFRQNVLTQAVTGKLTKGWREGKKLNNSLDLLNKLKLIQEQLIKSKIVRDIAINTHDRLNNFSDLPESWVITDLLNLSKIIDPNPTHRMPNYVSEGSPFISTENIVNENTLNLKIGKKVTDETVKEQIKRFEIKSGDFLFTRIGTIGKVCNLPLVRNYALSHAVCIISSYSEELCLPAYLKIALKSQKVLQQGIEGIKSVGVPDLGMGKVRAFQIPFPSKQEQQEIVQRVEALLAQADALEAQYESLKAKIEKLPQALLAKAFRGGLVPQDPTDEPASVLLQKIKAEAVKGGKKKEKNGQVELVF